MMKTLFFPKIIRRENYTKNENGTYKPYKLYRDEILHDCSKRCVYCDVKEDEIGYEGFALDHFRPQNKFPHLINNPLNLVNACQKCNRSKWHHWPIDDTSDEISFNSTVGFIDPFKVDRHDFFQPMLDGTLKPLKPPSEYMLRLLGLNRPTRVLVRRKRIIRNNIFILQEKLMCLMDDLSRCQSTENQEQFRRKIFLAKLISNSIRELLTMI